MLVKDICFLEVEPSASMEGALSWSQALCNWKDGFHACRATKMGYRWTSRRKATLPLSWDWWSVEPLNLSLNSESRRCRILEHQGQEKQPWYSAVRHADSKTKRLFTIQQLWVQTLRSYFERSNREKIKDVRLSPAQVFMDAEWPRFRASAPCLSCLPTLLDALKTTSICRFA